MLVWRRSRVAIQTGVLVALIVVAKLILEAYSIPFIDLSPLYTSVVAGGIFVIGLMVAGTLSDYKEAEKVPAEIVAALENIYEDARGAKETKPEFDLGTLRERLVAVVSALRHDLADVNARTCLAAITALSESILELERLDLPANYIVRLRAEQGAVRKTLLRVYHIQRSDFLPSAYVLIQTVVCFFIVVLALTKIDPVSVGVILLALISFFFIYLVRLLHILDRPFRIRERTMDDVSLFLLDEFSARVTAERVD